MRDLFTLGDEYANATETSEIFASVNGEVTATLAGGQAPLPELNHTEGWLCTHPDVMQSATKFKICCSVCLLCTHPGFTAELNQVQLLLQCIFACICFGCVAELTLRIYTRLCS